LYGRCHHGSGSRLRPYGASQVRLQAFARVVLECCSQGVGQQARVCLVGAPQARGARPFQRRHQAAPHPSDQRFVLRDGQRPR
jgi:hypothetical protein